MPTRPSPPGTRRSARSLGAGRAEQPGRRDAAEDAPQDLGVGAVSPERRPARVRVRAADGAWVVIRAAVLTTGSQVPAGYAVTLQAAPTDDLAPLLMRAWRLTRREPKVARLVIDGLSTEDIATAL